MKAKNERAIGMIQRDIENLSLNLGVEQESLDKLRKQVENKQLKIEELSSYIAEQEQVLKKLQSD